jgi:Rps23 Pro-64 3,4-dihydroxylase Tpa1-like proline 4-hydroxylase|tara:strand:- start:38 stop:883 length:846 start_codon:yes stop_codon:yes gene_type:complete
MNINKILSSNYQDLNLFAEKQSKNYSNGVPFSSIVIDNFFKEDFLNNILLNFPDLSKVEFSQKYNNKNEIKYANNKYDNFPDPIKNFIDFLNSKIYLNFLQKLTSIKEELVADPQLNGGGLHEIKKGGVLKIHTDFNRHPLLDLDRRINVLIYLNKNWKDEYGGHLELWDKMMTKCEKKISPIFNRMVVFSTNDFSYHGHPEPVICPMGESRKSIALYYFSKGRPSFEIDVSKIKNQTYFEDRHGFKNETENQSKGFKNFLRSLKFYQSMKRFEKKYLRKK